MTTRKTLALLALLALLAACSMKQVCYDRDPADLADAAAPAPR